MAKSPSHRFGQFIGNLLESIILPVLNEFCQEHELYLDFQGKRRPARRGKKVKWQDGHGNTHDLDFVIERAGTDQIIGQPLAFIEVAWRRYTRHSRNKAQEIQGAVKPLAEKYRHSSPFLGAVLAGEFTPGSIQQLQSLGFTVVYFPYQTLVDAFASEGLDMQFGEDTPDQVFDDAVNELERAPNSTLQRVKTDLLSANQEQFQQFMSALETRLERYVEQVTIIPLYGKRHEFQTVNSAFEFLDGHPIYEGSGEFIRYEIQVLFSNGDRVEGEFASKAKTREFLDFVTSQ